MPEVRGRTRQPPLVTVGIPAYQKERHLPATLDSLAAQTYGHFEVVIVDNGSTDRTVEICRQRAARDDRLRVFANRYNLGSRRNFNLTFELAQGDYFMWARGHDLWAPTYLERAVDLLEADRDLAMVHAHSREIDEDGEVVGTIHESFDTRGLGRTERMLATWRDAVGPATLGLVRTAAMDRTRLYQELAGCDIVFLVELAIQGTTAFLDEPLVSLRRVRAEGSEAESVLRTWRQMDPFRERTESPHLHALEYLQKNVELITRLDASPQERDELLSGLVDTLGTQMVGSITRAIDLVADRVEAAAALPAAAHAASPDALDAASALKLLDDLDVALVFQPDHARGAAARELLTGLAFELSAPPEALTPTPSS